jgi:hypothetical protein
MEEITSQKINTTDKKFRNLNVMCGKGLHKSNALAIIAAVLCRSDFYYTDDRHCVFGELDVEINPDAFNNDTTCFSLVYCAKKPLYELILLILAGVLRLRNGSGTPDLMADLVTYFEQ